MMLLIRRVAHLAERARRRCSFGKGRVLAHLGRVRMWRAVATIQSTFRLFVPPSLGEERSMVRGARQEPERNE